MTDKVEQFMLAVAIGLSLILFAGPEVQARDYHAYQAKILSNRRFGLYQKLGKHGPLICKGSSKQFRFGAVEAKTERTVHGQHFWYILVDGHRAGWVNQRSFSRNHISLAHRVSLVNNPYYAFPSRDAINYVTDRTGTVVDNRRVKAWPQSIYCGRAGCYRVTYTYGKKCAHLIVTVRPNLQEGITKASCVPQTGKTERTWKKHFRSSGNWGHSFAPEKRGHILHSGIFDLRTDFYQAATLSRGRQPLVAVGPTPEGLAISRGMAYFSMFEHPYEEYGRIVGYRMDKVPNKYILQKLPWLKWHAFKRIADHIKVSPLLKLGHGQAFSATKRFLYVIANDHLLRRNARSEEIMQIDKRDLRIRQIWTFKIWDKDSSHARYVHNAIFVNNHEFYAEYHDNSQKRFEYWCVRRRGTSWLPQEIGATKGNFMSNDSPVQGFAYDRRHHQFYLAFNDYLFQIAYHGRVLSWGHFHTGREFEGIAVNGRHFYAELAQRPELLLQPLKY